MLAAPPEAEVGGLEVTLELEEDDDEELEVLVFDELHAARARAPVRTSGMRRFTVTFRGRGSGKAAEPHKGLDLFTERPSRVIGNAPYSTEAP